MTLATVVGNVVSTGRNDGIEGGRFLLVESCGEDGAPLGSFLVALDLMGSGEGEVVLISQGSSARQTAGTKDKPVDAVIIGIVDLVEAEDRIVYGKDR